MQLDARQQDGRADRLGHVVGCTQIQASLFFIRVAQRGQKNYRNIGRARIPAQAAQYLITVHAGHHHIKQDDVGTRLQQGQAQTIVARRGGQYLVLVLKQGSQQVTYVFAVLNQQNARPRRHAVRRRWSLVWPAVLNLLVRMIRFVRLFHDEAIAFNPGYVLGLVLVTRQPALPACRLSPPGSPACQKLRCPPQRCRRRPPPPARYCPA